MAYTVELKPAAVRDLKKLDRPVQQRIAKVIDSLQAEPRPTGVWEIKVAQDLYRAKAGDYRILYTIDDERSQVLVVRIRHRREVYRP